ncbi:MAG: ATP-dependent Clp protease ATP-binding subunit, partial [Deltaproteobacteria bacterium]|nr:ATP-dependent Clp protease ATP-binding subunit [Deltaproteobacteria bacterium]
ELLESRRLDAPTVLKAARSFDERSEDAIGSALSEARAFAHRSAVPSRESFPSKHGDGARPAAAAEPAGIHVLVVLLSNRHFAAYRALTQCGVDISRLRTTATSVALGMVAPPRPRRKNQTVAPQSASARRRSERVQRRPSDEPRARPSSRGDSTGPVRRPRPQGRAVEVPLIPPHRLPFKSTPGPEGPPTPVPPTPPVIERAPISEPRPASEPPPESSPELASPADAPVSRPGLSLLPGLDPTVFPTLAALGHNLTLAAQRSELDRVIGREPEIEQVLDILGKRHANCPLLVGPSGVGKTSVARGVAAELAAGEPGAASRVLVELPVAELLAGTGNRGALAERIAAIRSEARAADGRVVLFIDEIHELLAGGGFDEALGEVKLAMSRGELPIIAATTPEEYRRVVESDAALARRFSVVEIQEPAEHDAFLLLRSVAESLREHHGVSYSDEAIAVSVAWSIRYLPGRALPDKAVSILDLAGARLHRRHAETNEAEVTPVHIAELISELADVPIARLLQTDHDRMLKLHELLAERVIGHDEACSRIAAVLRRNAAGLRGRRPVGTFLLLGPTGVGKTETAKAIAQALFHSPDAMTRLDMSEYSESHAVARVVGAPPGYVGHEAGGMLTEAVRKRPYQVILLDEIEKAHRDVLQSFLQVFDEGRLTDGRGRTVDFTHTAIVLTSNLGSAELRDALTERRVGFTGGTRRRPNSELNDVAVKVARSSLPPELYNRIDEVIYFRHLERADVRAIAARLLHDLGASLELRGVKLDVDVAAIDALLEHGGYDIELGARPMRRAVARLIEAPLADMILSGDLEEGSVALVAVEDGEIVVDAVAGDQRRSA